MKVRKKDGTWKEIIYAEPQLYKYGLNRISEREFSRHELTEKMKRLQPDEDMIQRVLDKLETMGYVSDERRADALIRMSERGEGWQKTVSRLKDKGISAELIAQKKAEVKEKEDSGECETELEKASRLLHRKFETLDRDTHQKALRFLVTKGFSFDVALKTIKTFESTEECLPEGMKKIQGSV
jgi:regulatory protein